MSCEANTFRTVEGSLSENRSILGPNFEVAIPRTDPGGPSGPTLIEGTHCCFLRSQTVFSTEAPWFSMLAPSIVAASVTALPRMRPDSSIASPIRTPDRPIPPSPVMRNHPRAPMPMASSVGGMVADTILSTAPGPRGLGTLVGTEALEGGAGLGRVGSACFPESAICSADE